MLNFLKHSTIEWKAAFRLCLPSLAAYFPLGLVFGVLCVHQGYQWFLAPLMSALVYAGSVQFIALSMLDDNAGIFAILLAATFVALRNSFYGISFIKRYKNLPFFFKSFLIFGLVDATYAILSIVKKDQYQNDKAFCFYVTLLPYLYWLGGTFVGALLGDTIPKFEGLSFILPSFFLILAFEFYLAHRDKKAIIFPIASAFAAYFIMPNQYLILAMSACVCFLLFEARINKKIGLY